MAPRTKPATSATAPAARVADNASLFAGDDVIERDIELPDGNVYKFYFKPTPAIDFRRFQIAETSQDESVRVTSMFRLIAASVCEPDGSPALTVEQAERLKPNVMNALLGKILEINRMGDAAKKPSPPKAKIGSGTS